MNYIEESKSEGEEIIKFFGINNWIFMSVYIQGVVGVFIIIISQIITLDMKEKDLIIKGVLLMGLFIIVKSIYDYYLLKSINMGITDKRVAFKKGIISRKTDEIRLAAVETVDVEQSIIGRMLDYGTVNITGKGESKISFKDIDEPIKIKKEIASILNKYKA